jgi:galactose mutarotase-like enzyme
VSELVRLGNGVVSAVLRPEVGCEIVELVDDATGINVLGSVPWGMRPAHAQSWASVSEEFWTARTAGGWNLLFPHAGAARDPDAGGLRPFHGEAGTTAWDVLEHTPDQVVFSTALYGSPFALERVVRLVDRSIVVTERVTNQSPDPAAASWGHHPTFGEPFIEPGVRIELPAAGVWIDRLSGSNLVGLDADTGYLGAGQRGPWPVLAGVDLSIVPPAAEPRALLAYADGLSEGRYLVRNDRLGIGVEVRWPLDLFPHVWLWQEFRASSGFPWFRRAYLMAVEPHSTVPEGGVPAITFEGGETIEATVTATLVDLGAGRAVGRV